MFGTLNQTQIKELQVTEMHLLRLTVGETKLDGVKNGHIIKDKV